jgi:histone-lysine N-methyltransferase SETMAR
MEYTKEEFRAYIKIRTQLGIAPKDIHEELLQLNYSNAPAYSTVKKWANRFSEGRTSIHDDSRSGRPCTSTTSEHIAAVQKIISGDPHVSVEDISEEVGISIGSVEGIVQHYLNLRKICARWIPKVLSEEQKIERVEASSVRR